MVVMTVHEGDGRSSMFGSGGIYYCMYFCIVVVVYSEQHKCNLMY